MKSDASSFFQQVEEKSLRDRVVINIRRAIEAGALKPGMRLVEADIAAQMGISRAPVREAIRLLEQEGFVRSIPRKGSFVVELTRQDIEEIYSLRSALEALAVKLASQHITKHDLDDLVVLVNEMRQAADSHDLPKLIESDLAFHERLVFLSNHERLIRTWMRMSTQLRLFLVIKHQLYENLGDIAKTHDPVLAALRTGDVNLAQQEISEHIIETGELVIASLDEYTDDTSMGEHYE